MSAMLLCIKSTVNLCLEIQEGVASVPELQAKSRHIWALDPGSLAPCPQSTAHPGGDAGLPDRPTSGLQPHNVIAILYLCISIYEHIHMPLVSPYSEF